MEFLIAAFAGLCLIVLLLVLYFGYGAAWAEIAGAPVDFAEFGAFFGGVLTPLLLWITLFLILHSLRVQKRELLKLAQSTEIQDMLRYLARYDDDLTHLLRREIVNGDPTRKAEFGDYVDSTLVFPKTPDSFFKSAMDKLLRLTANYCEAIGASRTVLGGNFMYDVHDSKARDLVVCLDKHKEHLSPMARQALSFCKKHLDLKNGH